MLLLVLGLVLIVQLLQRFVLIEAAGGGLALPFPRLAINRIGDRIGKNDG
jgi:hypothetical protein